MTWQKVNYPYWQEKIILYNLLYSKSINPQTSLLQLSPNMFIINLKLPVSTIYKTERAQLHLVEVIKLDK